MEIWICQGSSRNPTWLLSIAFIKANLVTKGGCLPGSTAKCLVHVGGPTLTHWGGGGGLLGAA